MKLAFALAALVTVAGCAANAGAPAEQTRHLTIDHLIDIRHPSDPVWSPDGTRVVFTWDRAGISNLYVADTTQPGSEPKPLTSFESGFPTGAFWSRDGQRVYFARSGDLWQVPAGGGTAAPIWTSPPPESGFAVAPDNTRTAFVRPSASPRSGMDLGAPVDERWQRNGGRSRRRQHCRIELGARQRTPFLLRGREVDPARADAGVFRGEDHLHHHRTDARRRRLSCRRVGGKATPIAAPGGGTLRWIDARRVSLDRISPDFKRHTITITDTTTGAATTLREEVDDKFWSIPGGAGPAAQPSPDGRWIAFLSDRDGWDHLYVVPAAGGDALQITKGEFEAWRPSWSPDSTRIAFDAERAGTTRDASYRRRDDRRRPGQGDPRDAHDRPRHQHRNRSGRPTARALVYQHTDPQTSADLFVVAARAGSTPQRLSTSMPAAMRQVGYVEPEYVHYPGPDGQQVPGWLFVPKGLDRSRKHPAVVWIHGDGVNQSYDGWHVQRNYAVYYSFHQYLLEQGYVVFAPDYRGSIGYGRAWRQGVYMDVGGKDAKDAWMAANYLKTLGYVDMDRVGVWGLSYGGFFTLIAMTDQPTLYRAGVDVAGVVDYAMYYEDPYHGGWTASRIGTPEQNPAVYQQASPLSHVDRLARPLLVLHGTADVNVPYLHSVRLVDELMKKGKSPLFDFMTYPGEFHYFTRAHVLGDAWRRVDEFFESSPAGERLYKLNGRPQRHKESGDLVIS